jgi:hypothetical protein
VDRELAANLELAAVFDQTKQAVVFENAEFTRHAATLEEEVPDAYRGLAEVYRRMAATESAMERRGPANSVRPDDRALIETWEGDLRAAQAALRRDARAEPPSAWARLLARLRGSRGSGR